MKKFLNFVICLLSILFFGSFTFLCGIVIFYKHNYDLINWFFLFLYGGMTLLFFWIMVDIFKTEETPKEKTKTENLKTDNPENDEIISVTEIKGVKKIIKNGKVIYCEQLKADELKVFEQLNEKNPTVTSGIKTYSKE